MVGERPKPFGEALGFDPITSTLIFGEYDAVLVDAMGTVAEAEALADWVALHNRNLETIYITHAHFDHFYGLSILLDRFPGLLTGPRSMLPMRNKHQRGPDFDTVASRQQRLFLPCGFLVGVLSP